MTREGPVEHAVSDGRGAFLVSVSLQSVVSLWDMRFNVRAITWQLPAGLANVDVVALVGATRSAAGGGGDQIMAGGGEAAPAILVGAGNEEVRSAVAHSLGRHCHGHRHHHNHHRPSLPPSLSQVGKWSLTNRRCEAVWRVVRDPARKSSLPASLELPRVSRRGLSVEKRSGMGGSRLAQLDSRSRFGAILSYSGGKGMITGGSDCALRCWSAFSEEKGEGGRGGEREGLNE